MFVRKIVIFPRKVGRTLSGMLIFTTKHESVISHKYSRSNEFGKSILGNINFVFETSNF